MVLRLDRLRLVKRSSNTRGPEKGSPFEPGAQTTNCNDDLLLDDPVIGHSMMTCSCHSMMTCSWHRTVDDPVVVLNDPLPVLLLDDPVVRYSVMTCSWTPGRSRGRPGGKGPH